MSKTKTEKTRKLAVTDVDFGRRVSDAVDALPEETIKNHGRLEWLAKKYEAAGGEKLPIETFRRWMAGIARPHKKRMVVLAKALEQDVAYLYGGFAGTKAPVEARKIGRAASASAELVSALIQLAGGVTQLPEASKPHIHMYAVIKGATYSINVAALHGSGEDTFAVVSSKYQEVMTLCVVPRSSFSFHVFEIPEAAITKHATSKPTGLELKIRKTPDGYAATGNSKGDTPLKKVENFETRI